MQDRYQLRAIIDIHHRVPAIRATNACPLLLGYISWFQPVTARWRFFNMIALALEMRVSESVP